MAGPSVWNLRSKQCLLQICDLLKAFRQRNTECMNAACQGAREATNATWTAIKGRFDATLSASVEHASMADVVLGDPDRFTMPPPAATPACLNLQNTGGDCRMFSAHYSRELSRAWATSELDACLVEGCLAEGVPVWFCGLRYHGTGHLVAGTVKSVCPFVVAVAKPLQFEGAMQFFANIHAIHEGSPAKVVQLALYKLVWSAKQLQLGEASVSASSAFWSCRLTRSDWEGVLEQRSSKVKAMRIEQDAKQDKKHDNKPSSSNTVSEAAVDEVPEQFDSYQAWLEHLAQKVDDMGPAEGIEDADDEDEAALVQDNATRMLQAAAKVPSVKARMASSSAFSAGATCSPVDDSIDALLEVVYTAPHGCAQSTADDEKVDEDVLDKVFKCWAHKAEEGLFILADRAKALATCELGAGDRLSLVEHDEESCRTLSVVQWTDPRNLFGRVIRLNPDCPGEVIYTASMMFGKTVSPHRRFVNLLIVHPDLGITMKKSRKGGRSQIPAGLWLLKCMWEQCMTNIGEESSALTLAAECAICGCSPNIVDALQPDQAERKLFTCSLCMVTSHEECCSALLDFAVAAGRMRPCAIDFELPELFHAKAMCRLCNAWLA